MSLLIRRINNENYLFLALNKNLTINCQVDTISNLITVIDFSETYYCDQKTLQILKKSKKIENIETIYNVPNICTYLYDNIVAYSNIRTNREFFNLIKKYLIGDNLRRGTTKIQYRKGPIITELLNNQQFIEDFSNLWFLLADNYTRSCTKSKRNKFVKEIALLVDEILTATDVKVKKEKQIVLERLFRSEKRVSFWKTAKKSRL